MAKIPRRACKSKCFRDALLLYGFSHASCTNVACGGVKYCGNEDHAEKKILLFSLASLMALLVYYLASRKYLCRAADVGVLESQCLDKKFIKPISKEETITIS